MKVEFTLLNNCSKVQMFPLGSQPTSSKKCGREECRLMRQENVSLKQKIKELEKKLNG